MSEKFRTISICVCKHPLTNHNNQEQMCDWPDCNCIAYVHMDTIEILD